MSYFNGTLHGWNDPVRGYIPPQKTTHVYCDACAESEIPLAPITDDNKGRRHWGTGFKWVSYYGDVCTKCGGET